MKSFVLSLCLLLLVGVTFGNEVSNQPVIANPGVEAIDLAKTETYTHGKFVYVYISPGLWTNTPPTGYLFINSNAVSQPVIGKRLNQVVSTPWDPMYWHGAPNHLTKGAGWLPYPNLNAAIPQLQPVRILYNR